MNITALIHASSTVFKQAFNRISLRIPCLVAWFVSWIFFTTDSGAQSLKLQLASQDGSVTRFSVSGANVPNVNLQGSFDLENWFLLQSATPVQGQASFAHTNAEPIDVWFYRAVAEPAPVPVNVGPQPDASQSAGAVITPEQGGQLEITDTRGVFYQFTVRSNLVREPVVVRMTVITNFTAMPLENRFRAAVVFEPDGFEFRGPAELKIRFPEPMPELEMVGYAFNGAGGEFHLKPWETATNEVTLTVSHFSGAGVNAESFPPAGNPNLNYQNARTTSRDAIRDADQWAGDRYRQLHERHINGRLTDQGFLEKLQETKYIRRRIVFTDGIRPLLAAAARNCDIGRLVLSRMDQLEGESGEPYGQSLEFREVGKLAPLVRCNCAHEYIERCEKDPSSSGTSANLGLTDTLLDIELMTGRTDAQGCDLGSDNQMFERLAKAPCHKAWEGTVRFERTEIEEWVAGQADSSGGF
ncbi:MAG: hypothetical protein EXS31_03315 [Pedosphaera sp.]|nr:hypothetical protein [Pedosphaera sp.]